MTNSKLTDEQLQEIYGEAVSCEVAEKNGAYMASFDLLCKMDDVGGTAYTVRKLIDMLRAERAELQERRKAEVPGYPETLPCPVPLEPGLKFGKGVSTRLVFDALRRRADYYAELEGMTPEQRAKHDAGIDEFKATLQGSQPVSDRDELPVL
ncbi:hypothetical protein DK741_00870 [Salmonella enterica subsp. enterica]|nr:hypothetical protein [Salmonella enterica subsp. enterica serovar Westeinde]